MAEAEQRKHVIEIAREWSRTPFADNASLKGIGVDCAHLLGAVYIEAGVLDAFPIEEYSPQFMLHSDAPLFEGYVRRFAREIPESEARAGDVVLYRIGRSFAHGALIVEWPRAIIHAFKSFGCVAETGGFEADLSGRKTKFFTFW